MPATRHLPPCAELLPSLLGLVGHPLHLARSSHYGQSNHWLPFLPCQPCKTGDHYLMSRISSPPFSSYLTLVP
ncbi:hypothetical protein JMJ78_0009754 [Colletotrichum scovillei]|nr:hypothetical protein JMJ78_0009754 [Colletotrichum scovillei]